MDLNHMVIFCILWRLESGTTPFWMDGGKREYFNRFLESRYGLQGHELYYYVRSMPEGQRHTLWAKLSKRMNLFERQILDFYHNTWSRQFFKNPYCFSDEICGLIRSALRQRMASEEVKATVFDDMMTRYPNSFHSEALRQIILRLLAREQRRGEQEDFVYREGLDEILELFASI